MTAPRTTDAPEWTGRPEEIKAVPVRHPGRWVAAVVVYDTRPHRDVRALPRDEPPLRVGGHRELLPVAPGARRPGDHHSPHRGLHGDRDRARRDPRGDAAVREPAAVRRELGVYLVLSRYPGPGPAAVLVQHGGPLPAVLARRAVRAVVRARERQQPRHRAHGGHPRTGTERGCLYGGDRAGPASCPSNTARWRRRRRWA